MNKEEKRLDRLNELLFALPVDDMPMTLSELDGYVTGVLACPEMVPPSEWRPEVLSEQFEQISSSAYTLLLACKQLPPLSESGGPVQLEI